MNRKAKNLRIAGSSSILLNIIIFFLPMVKFCPANYPAERFSQWDYVYRVFTAQAPYGEEYSTGRFMWVLFLIILPLLISLVAGIWGMVGNERQKVSSILIFVVLGLYIILFLSIGNYFPEEDYSRDIAGYCNLACSLVGSVIAIFALMSKEERLEVPVFAEIPEIKELKQEQVKAKYNIIQPEKESEGSSEADIPAYVPGPPKGIMVGLTGLYKGAVISFQKGESIRLGRLANNDLVFEGQEKVSRNHCYIRWDGEKFWIKDSSSNGTFVDEAEDCLPQNIEMEISVGSVIAIGDEHNTFRLE